MTDAICNIAGTRIIPVRNLFINPEGEVDTYHFRSILLDGFAERETYILSLKPNPLNIVSVLPDSLSEQQKDKIGALAFAEYAKPRFVDTNTDDVFCESIKGIAFRLWQALRESHSEFGMYGGQSSGEKIVYKINGENYTLKPDDGVTVAIKFIDRNMRHQLKLAEQHNKDVDKLNTDRVSNDDTPLSLEVDPQDYVNSMMSKLREALDATEEKDILGN